MSLDADSIRKSPVLFPHDLHVDKGTVSMLRLPESDYRTLSFLDERIRTPARPVETMPLGDMAPAAEPLAERVAYIFHIGHAGSTLLSRLLGARPDILPVREPAALRALARLREADHAGLSPAQFEGVLTAFLKLYGRTFAPEQLAVVKATSFVSELAADILARPSAPKAIFMSVSPQTYLATILAGSNSRTEARALAQSRMLRLTRRAGRPIPEPKSEGAAIAMSWACEMAALKAARPTDRILWLDFDAFLAEPQRHLAAAFAHLGISASERDISDIIAGPEMRRYSKAPEYEYGPQLRAGLLRQAYARHESEIRRGLEWLQRSGLPG